MAETETHRVIVTGANSGLGFSICCRLIDEFLATRPAAHCLALGFTVRDQKKSDDTVARLRLHLQGIAQSSNFSKEMLGRITFEPEIVDLNSLVSVQAMAQRRLAARQKIHAVILNAGIGGWVGVNWFSAIYHVLTDWAYAVTFPPFKISETGGLTQPQLSARADARDEDLRLGRVFCSNVFGHYMLVHWLAPLLQQSGRVIWISSLEAYARTFSTADMQGLKTEVAYEASKRLTDILALTAGQPETKSWVRAYLQETSQSTDEVKLYVSHPGICATGIMPLPWILSLAMLAAFYIARWLGSMWHTCTPYKGACAPVWLALAPAEQLAEMEARAGPSKWGSATDFGGDERVERTEVEGWGYGGREGDNATKRKGRQRGMTTLTKEDREQFVELGRECWAEMEKLRHTWEERLQAHS